MLGIGIVGLPNVGKSTLFNAITNAGVEAANYPFATVDKNVGVVPVPDDRLATLQPLYIKGDRTPPLVPTTVEFVDIAGLVRGASQGEGLGNQFLGNIREVAAIAHVVRCFEDPKVVHLSGQIDPLDDIATVETELALADIGSLERRLEKLRRSAKSDKDDAATVDKIEAMVACLSSGAPARATDIDLPANIVLLTQKPVVYVCNVAEADLASGNRYSRTVDAKALQEGSEAVVISAKIEQELGELPADEAGEFLRDLGAAEPGLDRPIRKCYQVLGLITFLTASEKEIRAWTVPRGVKAAQAAGTIHTDMEHGFIRAEVIGWRKLLEAGGLPQARSLGWLRTEGREYSVQDGDVMHILFNV